MSELENWLARLQGSQPAKFKLGLERINRVITELALVPQAPVITVAGTNGKGSTCAFLEAILAAAGYKPLCSYSPHLLDFSERLRINLAPVADDKIVEYFELIEQADAKRASGTDELSYFEYVTVASILAGNDAKCGAFVLEVGLGGRLDAVNAFDCDVAVITSIGIDHVEHLGGDRESIGREKAGILRQGRPLVLGDKEPPQAILEMASELEVAVIANGVDFDYSIDGPGWTYRGKAIRGALPRSAMPGLHQFANAATALAALEQLEDRLPVNQAEIRAGIQDAKLRGRFEIINSSIPVVLDVAHNAAAAKVLSHALLDMGYFPNTHFVIGLRANKDYAGIIAALSSRAAAWHLVKLSNDNRGDSLPQLRKALADADVPVHEYGDVTSVFASGNLAGSERIVVCGSFLTVEEFLRCEQKNLAKLEKATSKILN